MNLARLLRRHQGRHRIADQPPHPGYDNGPSPLDELGWPLNTPAARAELVDLAAQLRTEATAHAANKRLDAAYATDLTRRHLEAILRRWDTSGDNAA